MYHKWQSYDMGCDGQNVLSYWTIFCTFTPLTTWKIEILKKWKTNLEILSFYTCVQKIMIICYCSWDMVSATCNCYFSFWAIFCLFTPPPPPPSLTAQKNKILKKSKQVLEISSLYISVPKIMIKWCMVPEIWFLRYECPT